MTDGNSIGMLAAALGGAASFLSPCVLPLVPGYLSYTAGAEPGAMRGFRRRLAAIVNGLPFVAGFSTVFVLLGAGVSVVSRLLLAYQAQVNIVGGVLIILFGIMLTGWLRIPLLGREFRFHPSPSPGRRVLGGYLLGLAFAAGWTPCIGPILGAIMTLGATGATANATVLMIAYATGLGLPFLLAGATMDSLVARLRRLGHAGLWVQRISGILLVLMGIAVATGQLTRFAIWLLDTFPVLAHFG
ncbi:MAG: cytochrome c biogenesis protein CcdA [Gammaproteobacteria bacterium]